MAAPQGLDEVALEHGQGVLELAHVARARVEEPAQARPVRQDWVLLCGAGAADVGSAVLAAAGAPVRCASTRSMTDW